MSNQLLLPLPVRAAQGRSEFFVAPCNSLALQHLDDWQNWPSGKLALTGPEASGKTHLAHVWATQTGARIISAAEIDTENVAGPVVVEGADAISGNLAAQEQLFHLYNAMSASRQPLLLTGRQAPARWDLELPDLVSRLSSLLVARLEQPDDALLSMILVKLFADRQVDVGPDLIAYLVKRMGRSYLDAIEMVDRLDRVALVRQKPLTVRLAGQILRENA